MIIENIILIGACFLALLLTFACMSRCVAVALTYLGTPRQSKVLTYANPLPAMAYTRC